MAPWDALPNGQLAVKRGDKTGFNFCEENIVDWFCETACEKF
jgi:hypothetical protein